MMREGGKIQKSLPLYTEESVDLLQKALQRFEEVEGTVDSTDSFVSPQAETWNNQEDDDDISFDSNDDKQDSASSGSSSEETGDALPEDSASRLGNSELPYSQTSCPGPSGHQRPRPKQSVEQKQRQMDRKVQYHMQAINRLSFPISDTSALRPPAALLPRHSIKSSTSLQQCMVVQNLAIQLGAKSTTNIVLVVLIRSGRFAAGAFAGEKCVVHTTSTRYTVRRGQGRAQSSQDGNRRPKSMGAQLRRAGEQSLKEDIQATLMQWNNFFTRAALVFVSCPKNMKSILFSPAVGQFLPRNDPRLRNIPFDVGSPSFQAVCIAHKVVMTLQLEEHSLLPSSNVDPLAVIPPPQTAVDQLQDKKGTVDQITGEIFPLSQLHEAARDGNLSLVQTLLTGRKCDGEINFPAGHDFMTPLHFAAESSPKTDPLISAAIVSALLVDGSADPTRIDARNRVPYFLASHELTREAFRKARASLGPDAWDWVQAKVGPPLTEEDILQKKEKEAEKRRRKKAKKKEKVALEKEEAASNALKTKEQEEKQKSGESTKLLRAGLTPNSRSRSICDFCLTECKGRKSLKMFSRLDFKYCSTDCLQRHKRELMANAAMARAV